MTWDALHDAPSGLDRRQRELADRADDQLHRKLPRLLHRIAAIADHDRPKAAVIVGLLVEAVDRLDETIQVVELAPPVPDGPVIDVEAA